MQPQQSIGVGVLGCGTVGTEVIRFLSGEAGARNGLNLRRVAVRNLAKTREIELPGITDRLESVIEDPEIGVVVELLGGEEPARSAILESLHRGKSVVTGNKVVISRHMGELFAAARQSQVDLAFEASVGGGIPIIRVLNGYRGQRINKITGILNGTSNYILSRMEEGTEFAAALTLAQQKGFAETEHQLDTGGFDARDKLAILASIGFNTLVSPESIYCEGIMAVSPIDLDFARGHGIEEGFSGFAVKSVACAKLSGDYLELHVYPALVHREHPLASVRDEFNAIYLEGDLSGPQLFLGRGAGGRATASAVISDLLHVSKNIRKGVVDPLPTLTSELSRSEIGDVERRGYIRMNLRHVPGSIAAAAHIMGLHGLNIEDSIQRRNFKTVVDGLTVIPDIVTLEPVRYAVVREALADLQRSDRIHGDVFYMRFEE